LSITNRVFDLGALVVLQNDGDWFVDTKLLEGGKVANEDGLD
jgi:hypothetical protein